MTDLREAIQSIIDRAREGAMGGEGRSHAGYWESLGYVADELDDALDAHPEPTKPSPDDRETLAKVTADAWNSVSTLECTSESIGPCAVADAILAAGFRRPTVTPETTNGEPK